MADLGGNQNWLVSPNHDVELKWKQVRIQEKKSQLAGYKRQMQHLEQQIEDIKQGQMLDIEGRIIMTEREIEFLNSEIITMQGGQNG